MGEHGPGQGSEGGLSKAEAKELRRQAEEAKLLELGITRKGQRICIPLLGAVQSGDVEKIIAVFGALPGMEVVGATVCELTNSPEDESGLNVNEVLEEFCFRLAEAAYGRLQKRINPATNNPTELGNAFADYDEYCAGLAELHNWAKSQGAGPESEEYLSIMSDIETVDDAYNSSVVSAIARACQRLTPEGDLGKFCSPLSEEERQAARADLLELLRMAV